MESPLESVPSQATQWPCIAMLETQLPSASVRNFWKDSSSAIVATRMYIIQDFEQLLIYILCIYIYIWIHIYTYTYIYIYSFIYFNRIDAQHCAAKWNKTPLDHHRLQNFGCFTFFCAALEVNCCLFARRHPFTEKTVNQFNLCSRLLPWSEFKPKKKTWQE